MCRVLGGVHDPRCQPIRVRAGADDVGQLEELRGDAVEKEGGGVVRAEETPLPVHDDGRVGRVVVEDGVDDGQDSAHLSIGEAVFGVRRCEAGGGEKGVALAWWHVELLGEVADHLPTGPGSTRFHERDVSRRHLGAAGRVELGEPA